MNPQNPAQMALQQNQQQPSDPTQQTSPGILDALKQRVQQGAQTLTAEDQQQQQQNSYAQAAKAMAVLNPGANSSNSQANTMSKVGQAISTPAYAGYCQQFVDDKTGATQRYATASDTWNAKMQSGDAHPGLDGMKPGDVVEFAPDAGNGNMGHAALVLPSGKLQMATNSGVETYDLKDWINYSGQTPQGYYSPKE